MSITSVPPRAALPRGILLLLGMAAAVVVIGGMKATAGIIAPLFLALVLTVVAHPLRKWLDRWMPSWAASLVCIVVVYLIILVLTLSIVVSVARFATLLPQYTDEFDSAGRRPHRLAERASASARTQIDEGRVVLRPRPAGRLRRLAARRPAWGWSPTSSSSSRWCCSWPWTAARSRASSSGPRAVRPAVVDAISDFASGTRRYLAVSTVFGLIVAVLDTIALAILDVPAPVLWGLLAFITNYIPNIGFVIGLIPPAILALLEGGPSHDARGHRGLLPAQRGHPDGHPAQGRRGRGRPVHDALVRLADLLDLGHRPARRAARDPAHAARQGAPDRRRPDPALGADR